MKRILFIDYDECTGCRMCVMACSLEKTGTFNPARSRISIAKWEEEGIMAPVVCPQCEDPICIQCCPVDAIVKNEVNGVVEINSQVCIGCKVCMMVCPFGGLILDPIEGKIIKCDLCDGDPQCVKVCETGAIQYVKANKGIAIRRRSTLEKITRSLSRLIETKSQSA